MISARENDGNAFGGRNTKRQAKAIATEVGKEVARQLAAVGTAATEQQQTATVAAATTGVQPAATNGGRNVSRDGVRR